MPDVKDRQDEALTVATLVGKALRQRLGMGMWRAKPEGFLYVSDADEHGEPVDGHRIPYWLQEVKVDDGYRKAPVITDAYGRRFEVLVRPLPCCELDNDADGNCPRHPDLMLSVEPAVRP